MGCELSIGDHDDQKAEKPKCKPIARNATTKSNFIMLRHLCEVERFKNALEYQSCGSGNNLNRYDARTVHRNCEIFVVCESPCLVV